METETKPSTRVKLSGELERINFLSLRSTLYWREDTHTMRGEKHQRVGNAPRNARCTNKHHDVMHVYVNICMNICMNSANPNEMEILPGILLDILPKRNLQRKIISTTKELNPDTRLKNFSGKRKRYCLETQSLIF